VRGKTADGKLEGGFLTSPAGVEETGRHGELVEVGEERVHEVRVAPAVRGRPGGLPHKNALLLFGRLGGCFFDIGGGFGEIVDGLTV